VPEVLLSGNHAAIARWRRDMALRRTVAHRPDLIGALRDLDRRDQQVLAEAGFGAAEHSAEQSAERSAEQSGAPAARPAASGEGPSAAGFPVSGKDMAH
jgi:hypothetical protein